MNCDIEPIPMWSGLYGQIDIGRKNGVYYRRVEAKDSSEEITREDFLEHLSNWASDLWQEWDRVNTIYNDACDEGIEL